MFFMFVLLVLADAGRTATVYTNETDFVNALGSSASFLNDFDGLTDAEQYVHPLYCASNGLAYRITSHPALEIWSLIGSVSTVGTNVAIVTSFLSTNVHAVGGWFYLTDTNGVAAGGSLSISLNGGAAAAIPSSTNGPMFWGYISGWPLLTNLTVQSETPGGYPTLDHFYAAEGEPVIASPVVTGNRLILSWPAPSTGYVLQSSTNLATTNWMAAGWLPINTNQQLQVSVPVPGSSVFFRLVKP
jgi:hypothetical protein